MMLSPSGDGLGTGPEWGRRGNVGQSPITYAFTRHNSGANYGLTDGHAKWLAPDQVSCGKDAVSAPTPSKPDPDKGTAAGTMDQDFQATFSIN